MNNDLVTYEISILVSAHYPLLKASPTVSGSSPKPKGSLLVAS